MTNVLYDESNDVNEFSQNNQEDSEPEMSQEMFNEANPQMRPIESAQAETKEPGIAHVKKTEQLGDLIIKKEVEVSKERLSKLESALRNVRM